MGNTAQQCKLGLVQDSDFAGDFEDSKSTSGRILCIFGSHAFVPRSWMCKKQTSVSHGSTEAEVFSLDAGLRIDGIPAFDLLGLTEPNQQLHRSGVTGKLLAKHHNPTRKTQNSTKHVNLDLINVDHVACDVSSSQFGAMFFVFEDNEAVIR